MACAFHAGAVHHHAALGGHLAAKAAGKQQFAHIKGALHLGVLAHVEGSVADNFTGVAAFDTHCTLEVKLAFIHGVGAEVGYFVLCHVIPL